MLIKSTEAKKMDKPPPGYIAGISRGDTGFITRLDVGPMEIDPRLNDLKTSNNHRAGQRSKAIEQQNFDLLARPIENQEFDQWSGYTINIFKNTKYTQDDKGNLNNI